jgi:O-antigen/teichoic acid export membrane protein
MLTPLFSPRARSSYFGIADNALLSITNLVIGITMARESDPAAFGVYVFAFALQLMLSSVHVSLITDPLIVLGSAKGPESQLAYFGAVFRIHLALSSGLAIVIAVMATLWQAVSATTADLGHALFAVSLSTIPLLTQSYARAMMFAGFRPRLAFLGDALFSTLRLLALLLLGWTDQLTTFSVLLSGGFASALAAAPFLVGGILSQHAQCGSIRATLHIHWNYGRWLLAGSGTYWISGQAPALLGFLLMSPVAAAIIKACQYLVAPLNVGMAGLDGVVSAEASRTRLTQGEAGSFRYLRNVSIVTMGGAILYSLVLLPNADSVMRWLYSGLYSGHTLIVFILLSESMISALSRPWLIACKLQGQTLDLFLGGITAVFMTFICVALGVTATGIIALALAGPLSAVARMITMIILRKRRGASDAEEKLRVPVLT